MTRDERIAQFWGRVEKDGPCWLWTGAANSGGYGMLSFCGKRVMAHRLAYELTRGPIPNGLVIDHLCRVRSCCDPDHMEAVTQRVNILRGVGYTAIAVRKTHCVRGHEYTPQNTVKSTNGRWCRTCRAAWQRAYSERKLSTR